MASRQPAAGNCERNARCAVLVALVALWSVGWAPPSPAAEVQAWAGRLDGSWHWQLPSTANGLRPYVSWHATGSAPDGDIYVAGMDHQTNSALYRIRPEAQTLSYAGDARSASEAAGNWRRGESAEKLHTRPTWHRGQIYVATMDYSAHDDGYRQRRGFHWYAYDPTGNLFTDLSAGEPNGVGARHLGIVTIASDALHNLLYGAAVPTGHIFRFDVGARRTTDLGRPNMYDRDYLYVGRFMWVDGRGRLYLSAGNSRWSDDYGPAIYGHLRYYDPASGFGELPEWRLQAPRAIETGQCASDRKTCWLADDLGHIHRFDDDGPSWSYLGRAIPGADRVWVFQVSLDGRKAYALASPDNDDTPRELYEFDLLQGVATRLCRITDLDPRLADFDWHTGYGAWDRLGRFYFVNFPSPHSPKFRKENAIVTGIDPVRLKRALRVTAGVTEVSIEAEADADGVSIVFTRTGEITAAQSVLYVLDIASADSSQPQPGGTVVIPAGSRSARMRLAELPAVAAARRGATLSVIGNGNDYVIGSEHKVRF